MLSKVVKQIFAFTTGGGVFFAYKHFPPSPNRDQKPETQQSDIRNEFRCIHSITLPFGGTKCFEHDSPQRGLKNKPGKGG